MSYSTLPGGASGYMTAYPTEPMALDIAALQYLYGAANQNSGNTVYDLASAQMQTGFHAVWDSNGIDTLDASGVGRAVTLDLHEGARSDIGAHVTANATVNGSSASTTYSSTLTIATGAVIENAVGGAYNDVIIGTDGVNALWGNAGNDRLEGRAGNDVINGGAGSDSIDGGVGFDVASYDSTRANFTITKTAGGYTVTGEGATDTLTGVERLVFSDGMVALDVDGNAGTIAKLLAAVFGAQEVHNEQYIAIGLSLLDSGMNACDIAQLAINARLGGPSSNGAVVDLLYANVMGSAPSASEHALYAGLLDSGQLSQGALGQLAANTAMNQSHIDLVGLASSGLDYAL
jgi:Ca2+-binding RTX toxin-like protein